MGHERGPKFQRVAGKGVSLVHFSSAFASCFKRPCTPFGFPTKAFDDVRAHGSIPFFSWGSSVQPVGKDDGAQLASQGRSGGARRPHQGLGEGGGELGHPFFLTFNWEMNGRWYPWSAGPTATSRPTTYAPGVTSTGSSTRSGRQTSRGCGARTSIPTGPSHRCTRCTRETPTSTGPASTGQTRQAVALVRRALRVDVRQRSPHRADQADGDRRDRVHRARRVEGYLDHRSPRHRLGHQPYSQVQGNPLVQQARLTLRVAHRVLDDLASGVRTRDRLTPVRCQRAQLPGGRPIPPPG